MAKEKEEHVIKREVRPKKEKVRYIPKVELFLGLVAMAAAVVRYFGLYDLPIIAMDVLLFLVGLLLVWLAFKAGLYKKRKERLLKHI